MLRLVLCFTVLPFLQFRPLYSFMSKSFSFIYVGHRFVGISFTNVNHRCAYVKNCFRNRHAFMGGKRTPETDTSFSFYL